MLSKLIPVPSSGLLTERDIDKSPILECINLGITFGGLKAVENFNITIGRSEISGLIGPNGAGKTTIFNLLTKVYQPTTGTVLLDGKDTHGMNTMQVNRAGIARTFQNIRLFSNMSVEDNVKCAMDASLRCSMAGSILRLPGFSGRKRSPMTGPWSGWRSSVCRTWRTPRPVPCPTAPSAAWRSPGLSPRTPASCCWTSRRRA